MATRAVTADALAGGAARSAGPSIAAARSADAQAPLRWVGCRCCGLACGVPDAADSTRPAGPAVEVAAAAASEPPPDCPRCGEPLPRRQALDSQRTWALLLASVAVYVPANLLPMMGTTSALSPSVHTILGGIVELWEADNWLLAVIVFVASIAVPLLKIVALALLAWAQQQAPHWRRPERATLYRLVDAVGHWSMLDVYVVVLLTAMVHFGRLANVSPEPGLVAFTAMVILTLLAADSVDPHRIWDELPAEPAAPADATGRRPAKGAP